MTNFMSPQSQIATDSSSGFPTAIDSILASFKNLCISTNSEKKVATDDRDYYEKLMDALSTKSSTSEAPTLTASSTPLNL